ncbi:hypothetical protein PFICI_05106 [Pestalotiopsis fici W106-1]|uniref:ARCA protein n=1 Tax=Pestalotiopsis fici (strain W106-1 / CGMCC3.15140) TaxID=1229662 RepID=W3XB24_PESFW|nr:uncharacterized protein PFICI_05106 [Pestalotiopsis fici W106-1]ETS83230.1 hypothetical protein PFICI_05106 [Pestalotiopsis fici W106-1]
MNLATDTKRHVTSYPEVEQKWTQIPTRLFFVDETQEVRAFYTLQNGETHYPFTAAQNVEERPEVAASSPQNLQQAVPVAPYLLDVISPPETTTLSPAQSATGSRVYSTLPPGSALGLSSHDDLNHAILPFRNATEVRLMKYYLEHMCHWFDLCDNQRHFAVEVPRRAIACPTLLNAIFALSSRHLSMGERFDPYAADRYQQECLNQLSAIILDSSTLSNDDLLAATILLRTLEEMDVPLIGADHELHLHGIQLFMSFMPSESPQAVGSPAQPPAETSSLRQACFWTGLRQEIVMAFVNQRPVKVRLDHPFIDRSLAAPAADDVWANRIILHCADVLRYCFGGSATGTNAADEWLRLKAHDDAWLRARPSSWLPVAYSEPEREKGEVFPTILYLSGPIVIGNAHATFARALLKCYDPTIPKIGPGQKLAQQKLDTEIRTQIRELCATALSNRATVPAMFTASMGVTMCGDRFTDDRERGGLLDLLIKTEIQHFWPTGGAQDHLKKAWGWAVE